ncbi:unnamed protein product, partial [Amoebophrya sp. A120]
FINPSSGSIAPHRNFLRRSTILVTHKVAVLELEEICFFEIWGAAFKISASQSLT